MLDVLLFSFACRCNNKHYINLQISLANLRGEPGTHGPWGPNSFIFMQFPQTICQITGFWGMTRPPRENPGSATGYGFNTAFILEQFPEHKFLKTLEIFTNIKLTIIALMPTLYFNILAVSGKSAGFAGKLV